MAQQAPVPLPGLGVDPVTKAERSVASGGPPPPTRPRTGVVWVHGIGTQLPGDSLFPWTQPVLDVFAEWRRQYDRTENSGPPIGENPVDSASVVDPNNRWILADIPSYAGRPRAEWLFTEAYWAADVRPPSFGAAASYMLRNLRGVIEGIAYGYNRRKDLWASRRNDLERDLAAAAELPNKCTQIDRAKEAELASQDRWRIIDALDAVWSFWPVRTALMLVGTVVATITLSIYAALHAIPIPAIKKRVEIAAADTFIVEFFADLAVILDDQAQGAAIRTRLRDRVLWLKAAGCDDVVLLAHSGGTIVSFATLLRFADADLPVSKLVTFGEAIKLGWRLEDETGDWYPGNSVRGDLYPGHKELRWVDIWASYDPAPSGPLDSDPRTRPDGDCPLEIVSDFGAGPNPNGRVQVESRPVTNYMSLADDHGGYWANDEGFILPVIRHIDDPRGSGENSRFYRARIDRTLRIERRRRRVALLLAWRWTAFAAAVISLLALLAPGAPDAAATGNEVAAVWSLVPGGDFVSGIIDGVGNVVAVILNSIGFTGFTAWLGSIGPTILGALVPILGVLAIFMAGNTSWTHHDALERRAIRAECLQPSGYGSARSEATLVVGGLIAVMLASWTASAPAVLACLAVTALLALVVRRTGPRRDNAANIARVDAIRQAR